MKLTKQAKFVVKILISALLLYFIVKDVKFSDIVNSDHVATNPGWQEIIKKQGDDVTVNQIA